MKWPKTSADLLSEKTFLVIREDLRNLGVIEKRKSSTGHRSSRVSSCSPRDQSSTSTTARCSSDTWPKMRKKRQRKTDMADQSSDEEPRPATASLEAPLVLDPRLVDKLDMTLLSKEHLSALLTRINLGVVKVASVLDTSKLNAQRQATALKSKARFANVKKSSAVSRIESRSSEAASSPEETKRFDANNNKNKRNSNSSCNAVQQRLSPLRSRSSRSTARSSDVALFTANVSQNPKKMSEPCTTCKRAAHPERFHSHPKSPCASPVKSPKKDSLTSVASSVASARSSPSIIPIRAGARNAAKTTYPLLSPTMTSPRSELLANSFLLSATEEEKSSSEEALRKVRSVTSSAAQKSTEDKASSKQSRRPRSITCYICGREFGTASFPIHEPKCLQKWERENKALPLSQRRSEPQRPNVPIDHEDWNEAAWEQSQALLIPCLKCKRTFLPDRLAIHERNCRAPNKVFHKNL